MSEVGVRPAPVLLVHGFGSSFDHGWRRPGWVDLLADAGREVIPVDILGHGEADHPHDAAAYEGLESSVERVLPGTPVDAAGFSLGALLLLKLAVADVSRFSRLVLIGVGQNVFGGTGTSSIAAAFEREPPPDDVIGRLFLQYSVGAGNDPLALRACLRRTPDKFTPEEIKRVTCPVLVIIGDRDFAGPADGFVEALPDARLVVLRGVDHFQVTRDFRCIDAALDFFDARI